MTAKGVWDREKGRLVSHQGLDVPVKFMINHRQELFSTKSIGDTYAMEYGFLAAGSSKLVCDGFEINECISGEVKIASDYVSSIFNLPRAYSI
jgi:hypothetical protein